MYTHFQTYLLLGLIASSLTLACASRKHKNSLHQTPAKLQVCPDAWYINNMPTISATQNPPNEYMVINGKRVEISEVDLDWVQKNCAITQPTPVN
jgi:hypothetical protein